MGEWLFIIDLSTSPFLGLSLFIRIVYTHIYIRKREAIMLLLREMLYIIMNVRVGKDGLNLGGFFIFQAVYSNKIPSRPMPFVNFRFHSYNNSYVLLCYYCLCYLQWRLKLQLHLSQ